MMHLNAARRTAKRFSTGNAPVLREFDPLGVGFEPELFLLKDDIHGTSYILDGIRNAYRRVSPGEDLKSTEFKSVLDDFLRLKLNKATDEATEKDRNQSFEETCKPSLRQSKRRNATDHIVTPGDLGLGFNQLGLRFRRGSLPTLGLKAVDIQFSVPIKSKTSWSIQKHKSIGIPRGELPSITEIPNTATNVLYQNGGAFKRRNPADTEAVWKSGRRLSLGDSKSVHSRSTLFGIQGQDRGRVGVQSNLAKDSKWRIQIHKKKDCC